MTSIQEGEALPVQEQTKRGRGRPRKHALPTETQVKRGRGRPRKYSIIEKEMTKDGVLKPVFKKVDSGHLVKHFLNYFTKLLVLHHELSKDMGKQAPIFARLKNLDFQMVEVCKNLLTNEYKAAGGEVSLVEGVAATAEITKGALELEDTIDSENEEDDLESLEEEDENEDGSYQDNQDIECTG